MLEAVQGEQGLRICLWKERHTVTRDAELKALRQGESSSKSRNKQSRKQAHLLLLESWSIFFRITDQERAVLNAHTYNWGVTYVTSAECDACMASSTITCDGFTLTARCCASACLKVSSATAAVAFSPVMRAAARNPLQLATCKTQ